MGHEQQLSSIQVSKSSRGILMMTTTTLSDHEGRQTIRETIQKRVLQDHIHDTQQGKTNMTVRPRSEALNN
jgi:hypothetical protein